MELVGEICHEKGLDVQNYQCCGCSRPIGMCQSQLLLFFLLVAVRTPHAEYYALFVGCVRLLKNLAVFIAKFKIKKYVFVSGGKKLSTFSVGAHFLFSFSLSLLRFRTLLP